MMNRREFMHQLSTIGSGVIVATSPLNVFAQTSSPSDEGQLAKRVARYVIEIENVREIIHRDYADSTEFVDILTGQGVSDDRLPWKSVSQANSPFRAATLDVSELPPNIVPWYFTNASVEFAGRGFMASVDAKIYLDGNGQRDYGDRRNSLNMSFIETDRTAEEVLSVDHIVTESLIKTFGVKFTDKGIKGLAEIVQGNGNQQMYIRYLEQIEQIYSRR